MSDTASASDDQELQNAQLQKAVIVALRPGQPPRVLAEAMHYAGLLQAPLVVVHVDVTRFVTFEDPDGMVHSAPIDLNIDTGAEEFAELRGEVEKTLAGSGLTWTARQLVGDPALAIKHLAGELDARLIVVGTRSRGIGESIREFFTGSVAARLSHRQSRPILVVPLEDPVPDSQKEIWVE